MKALNLPLFCLVALCLTQYTRADELESRRWINDNLIPVESVDEPLSVAEQRILDKALVGKRIVFLGEAAHWVHQKYDYRLRFLKYLAGKGFNHIGMEMGLSDGARIDRFLASGKAADLKKVVLYGYRGPTIRTRQRIHDCHENTKPYPGFGTLFVEEETWFYTQLQKLSEEALSPRERIHHFGYDVDTVTGGAYEDIDASLKDYRSFKKVAELINRIAPVANEAIYQEISRLENVLADIESGNIPLQNIIGKERQLKIKLSLKTLIQSLRFELVYLEKPCDEKGMSIWTSRLLQAMAEREQMMFTILRNKLAEIGPYGKIVLMGHNFHLSKNPKDLWFASSRIPEPHAPTMWPSVGEFVNGIFFNYVYSIWMIHNRGFQSTPDCRSQQCPVDIGPKSLGTHLSSAGQIYSLPLSDPSEYGMRYLNQRLDFAVNAGTYSGNVAKNADLIFFVDEVSGLKKRP